jgi:hypothetical protein
MMSRSWTTHTTWTGSSRAFESIFAAAEEAGSSRIYARIHYPSGNVEGLQQGRCVAARVRDLEWRR